MMSIGDYTVKMIRRYEDRRNNSANSYVKLVLPDDTENLMTHGGALKDAFIAGAKWQVMIEMGE